MTAKLLEKHITDTIREWQVKIGYEGGTMKLYYPAESLRRSLSLDETEDLDAALAAFCKEVQPRLGTLAISAVKHNGTGSKLLFFLCRENAYYRGRKRIRGA